MAYRDDITALGADHLWRFDGDLNDSVGTTNGTNTGFSLTAGPCCEDATNAAQCNTTADRVAIPTAPNVDGALTRKVIAGWLRMSAVQLPPKSIYREGAAGNQFNLTMWAGNTLMLDIVNGSTVLQVYSDKILQPGRNYHICAVFEGSGFGNKFALYIDGVEQQVTNPSSAVSGFATLGARTAGEWGDPSGATEVGNATVLLNGPVNANYNFWAAWGADTLTDTEIREELFEKGALPDVTITNQAGLDALADTVRGDAPLAIRVDVAGSLTLTADNVTFDPDASIHVQYTGTGTLTWINTNGANASIGSTPNGGTINFITPSVLTVAPLIANTEVRVYESGTTTEVAGVESSGTSFQNSISVNSVDVVVHKEDYVYIRVNNVDMTGGDVSLPIEQIFDRNYENP